jgi:hypothetical protein
MTVAAASTTDRYLRNPAVPTGNVLIKLKAEPPHVQ